jgi:hypothetical protein
MIYFKVKLQCPCGESHTMICEAIDHGEAGQLARLVAEDLDKSLKSECNWNTDGALDSIHVYSPVQIEPTSVIQ